MKKLLSILLLFVFVSNSYAMPAVVGVIGIIAAEAGIVAWSTALLATASAWYSDRQAKKLQREAEAAALAASKISGTLVSSRTSAGESNIVFGQQVRIAGTPVFMEVTPGNSNRWLFVIYAFARHQLGSTATVQVGDVKLTDVHLLGDSTSSSPAYPAWDSWYCVDESVVPSTDPQYTYLRDFHSFRWKWFGDADNPGTMDADFLTCYETYGGGTNWSSDHKMSGMAYLCCFCYWGDNGGQVWPQGLPNITVITDGVPAYGVSAGNFTTTSASSNPVEHIYTFLRNTEYGLGVGRAEIDETNFTEQALICNEQESDWDDYRYTCHGAVSSGETAENIIGRLLDTCAGELCYTGGQWKIYVGAWRTPVHTLDEDDLRGPIEISTSLSRRDKFNSVKGVFRDPDTEQPAEYPPVVADTFVSTDGEQMWLENDIDICNSAEVTQRVSYILLEKARQQIQVKYPCSLKGLKLIVGDTVYLDNTRFGWSQKIFDVKRVEIVDRGGGEIGVDLELQETAETIYDDYLTQDYDPSPDTNLPFAGDVDPPSNLAVDEVLVRQGDVVTTEVTFTWDAPTTPWTSVYDVKYYKDESDPTETQLGEGYSGNRIVINFQGQETQLPAYYVFAVRSKNLFGAYSDWVELTEEIKGKTAKPPTPTGLTYTHTENGTIIDWDDPLDTDADFLDWKETEVRRTGVSWEAAIWVRRTKDSQYNAGFLANGAVAYWVKHIDTQPQECEEAAEVNVSVEAPNIGSLEARAVAGKALLTWTVLNNGSYGVKYYEIRKGSTYVGSAFVSNSNGPYVAVEELNTGTYTYWVTGYDPGGNETTTLSVSIEIPPQPNFELLKSVTFDVTTDPPTLSAGTVSNWAANIDGVFYINDDHADENGSIYPLVDGTETWADHFSGFTTMQDVIDAGHIRVFEPVENSSGDSCQYFFAFDLGYVYPEIIGVEEYVRTQVNDDCDWTFTLRVRETGTWSTIESEVAASSFGSGWTEFVDTTQLSYTNVRYIGIEATLTDAGDRKSLVIPQTFTTRINVAKVSDEGKFTYASGTASHTVTFANTFLDISTIKAEVLYSGTPTDVATGDIGTLTSTQEEQVDLFVVFDDVANPTDFDIILVNANDGLAPAESHKVSWTATGY